MNLFKLQMSTKTKATQNMENEYIVKGYLQTLYGHYAINNNQNIWIHCILDPFNLINGIARRQPFLLISLHFVLCSFGVLYLSYWSNAK